MSASPVIEPEKKVPVVCDVDVAVAGAGMAGVFAAIAAARNGADTILIDRFDCPGGNIGPGFFSGGSLVGGAFPGGLAGIPREFIQRHIAEGGGTVPDQPSLGDLAPSPHGGNFIRDANIAVYVLLRMLKESGVRLLLSTFVAAPVLEDARVSGIFTENKSGRTAIRAKVVVDATGEADVVARAGAAMLYPKSEYHEIDGHAPGGAGAFYALAGVDEAVFGKYQAEREAKGEPIRLAKVRGPGICGRRDGPERVDHQDGTYGHDGMKLSDDTVQMRLNAHKWVEEMRGSHPGLDDVFLLMVSPYYGLRGGPCIEGAYVLTYEDTRQGRRFPDVVCLGQWKKARVVDITDGDAPPKDRPRRVPEDAPPTDFPYRAMIPKELDGLIAVGRSASSIPDTLLRTRPFLMHVGQAGGTAAALAVTSGVLPRELDVKALQEKLVDEGFFLGDAARLKELGLT